MVSFFGDNSVIVCDPELARQILMNPSTFSKDHRVGKKVSNLFGNGLLIEPNIEAHRRMRNIASEAFTYANLKLYFPIFTHILFILFIF